MKKEYREIVDLLEHGLKSYAKKSFEVFSPEFIGGGEIERYFANQWGDDIKKARISNRTPLQIERDGILYSNGMRKLNEKNHVLYSGSQRVIRNYTTHTMRMAQVTRAICRGLGLNEDFAEGIALGAKVGSVPFVHVSKKSISNWIENKIKELDKKRNTGQVKEKQISMFSDDLEIPTWLSQIQSEEVLRDIKRYFPFGAGNAIANSYSSGKQGYWMLSTNPYSIEPKKNNFSPETMYGIWQHSLDKNQSESFGHEFTFGDSTKFELSSTNHKTFEAAVVQYADDITWVIENLNDAHQVVLLDNTDNNVFKDLSRMVNDDDDFPSNLSVAINRSKPGLLYTYFIDDFVTHSQQILNEALKSQQMISRDLLIKENVKIGLSSQGIYALNKLKQYLNEAIFSDAKIDNRNRMLETITDATLEILWEDRRDTLQQLVTKMGKSRDWEKTKLTQVLEYMENDVHRVQLVVNLFSEMSDSEIFSFIGIESF